MTIADNLEHGRLDNLAAIQEEIRFLRLDLRDPAQCLGSMPRPGNRSEFSPPK